MKKSIMSVAALLACSLFLGSAIASAPAPSVTAEEALQKLMDGNKHYVENKMTSTTLCDLTARKKLSTGQSPYAIILSCSDSRVPPELVFDKGLGEIFVIRVAGNIPDPIVIGSVEYAAEHLGSPLVMVLGHERCGAVTATVESKGKAEGNIGAIVKAIAPAMKVADKECPECRGDKKCREAKKSDYVECVVNANAKRVAANLTKQSKILSHLVESKKLKIVSAKYDLDDGTVTLLK